MKTEHLIEKRTALVDRREKLIARFNEGVRKRKSTTRVCNEIRKINEFIGSLERIEAENTGRPNTGPRRYAVSSLFLHECYKKLTADKNEQFFFITGSEVENVFVLDQCAEFAHQRRTEMGVVGHFPSTHNVLIKLEQFGHKFLAHFHSHPGTGPDSTHPSGTDEKFQTRLESGGHLALMAVFSRDGYVRFIRMDQNFEIEIYGEGVESHAPNIYRLKNAD
jgi:hypothetical protein